MVACMSRMTKVLLPTMAPPPAGQQVGIAAQAEALMGNREVIDEWPRGDQDTYIHEAYYAGSQVIEEEGMAAANKRLGADVDFDTSTGRDWVSASSLTLWRAAGVPNGQLSL